MVQTTSPCVVVAAPAASGGAGFFILPFGNMPATQQAAEELAGRLLASFSGQPDPSRRARWVDVVEEFIAARCERRGGVDTTAAELWAAYCEWAATTAHAPTLSPKAFGRALSALGFARLKSNNVSYLGIRLSVGRELTSRPSQ